LRFRKQFEELTSDVAATCARYHAREAETIRKLKLVQPSGREGLISGHAVRGFPV
jgi:hypothetical protein